MSRHTLTPASDSRVEPSPTPPESRRGFTRKLWLSAAILACGAGAGGWWLWSSPWMAARRMAKRAREQNVPTAGFEVVKAYDHDRRAFTQGLVFAEGDLYESTGHYEQSTLRRVELTTGKVLDRVALQRDYFAEGLALVEDELFQLTWREQTCLVYDRKTLRLKRQLRYWGEGWGLAHDGKHLIMSNGTDVLQFLDPRTFRVEKRLAVTLKGEPLELLNELEYVGGEIWANVWYWDSIARIDPKTGAVNSLIDLSTLWPRKERTEDDVLNGIAHDAKGNRLFVTGKNWPKLYEIRVVAK